jgi:predicted transcriptional regulator
MLHRMNTTPITPTTGPTEREVLAILWEHGPLTVRQVRAILQKQRPIAYTTILTVSGRMEEKGLLLRTTAGASYNGIRMLTQAVLAVCRSLNATTDDRAALLAALGDSHG